MTNVSTAYPPKDAFGSSDEDRQRRMSLMRLRPPPLAPIRERDRQQPSRRIVRRGHKGPVGNLRSERHGRVDYENHLERDFLMRMIVDPEVFDLRHQPMMLLWNDEGVPRKHYPDFSYRRRDRSFITEVKPHAKSHEPLIQRRTAIFQRRFAREGITYELVTSDWIRREPDLGNAQELHLSIGYEPTELFISEALHWLWTYPDGIAFADLVEVLQLPPDAIYLAYALVRNGHARLGDPDSPIGPNSRIVTAKSS